MLHSRELRVEDNKVGNRWYSSTAAFRAGIYTFISILEYSHVHITKIEGKKIWFRNECKSEILGNLRFILNEEKKAASKQKNVKSAKQYRTTHTRVTIIFISNVGSMWTKYDVISGNTLITAIAKPKLYAGECPLHWIPQKKKKKKSWKKRYHTKRQKCKHSWRINFNVSHFGHNSEPINQNKSPIQCRIASKLCTFTACTYLHCATATHFS